MVQILKLIPVRDSEDEIVICVRTCNMNSTLGSVVPLAMFSFIPSLIAIFSIFCLSIPWELKELELE